MNECYLIGAAGGYKLITDSGTALTPVFYFGNYRQAVEWAENYLTSYTDFRLVLDREIK